MNYEILKSIFSKCTANFILEKLGFVIEFKFKIYIYGAISIYKPDGTLQSWSGQPLQKLVVHPRTIYIVNAAQEPFSRDLIKQNKTEILTNISSYTI